jgi:hypothetical protein
MGDLRKDRPSVGTQHSKKNTRCARAMSRASTHHVHELVVAAEDARHAPIRVQLDGQMLVHVPKQNEKIAGAD